MLDAACLPVNEDGLEVQAQLRKHGRLAARLLSGDSSLCQKLGNGHVWLPANNWNQATPGLQWPPCREAEPYSNLLLAGPTVVDAGTLVSQPLVPGRLEDVMGCSWCHDGRHIVVLLAAPGQMARDGPTSMARQLCVVKVVTGMPPTMTAAPRACDTFAPCFGNIDMCWRAPLDKLMAPEADAVLLLESQRAAIVCELPSMEVRA
ncbi:hypothetical protein WJX84_001180 [Apatococcus fuscideae]|uniref:Uncharacterized protein n=1 Tax=Apatococcus fuscideae TaxID=2026836 RepID=A0AAW1T0V2_9CHLO